MITLSHRGQKISLSQKAKQITAKVNSVTVFCSTDGTAEEAIKAAKKFIDEMLGVVSE